MEYIDPICGMTVRPETAAAHLRYGEKDYYFCSKGCGEKFSRDPEAFLAKDAISTDSTEDSYRPLIVIILLIALATLALSAADAREGAYSINHTLRYFMTGFFLVFAGFKLVDLKGFAEGYSTYDLLAMRWYGYGYVYPFIELGFGLVMLMGYETRALFIAEFLVMAFSGIGVAVKLIKQEPFQCACLGTFLKVPLTKVTLIEDFGMAGLALAMLFLTR